MNQFTKGQLAEICQMVFRGSKPCGMMPIKSEDFQLAKIICIEENCKFKDIYLSKGWKTLWIYVRDEISQVIDQLPEEPKTLADHYLLGSLFGYSNESICDYLERLNAHN